MAAHQHGHAGPADDAPDFVGLGRIERDGPGLDPVSRDREGLHGPVRGDLDLGVERSVAEARHIEDPQRPETGGPGRSGGPRAPVAPIGTRQHPIDQPGVGDRAGEGAHHLAIGQHLGKPVRPRIAADRRFEADEAGVARRPPDGAAAIRADRHRHEPGRDARRGPAARAARRKVRVPRVAGRAEEEVRRIALESQFGDIGLADQHGAGPAQTFDRQFVRVGHEAFEGAAAPGGRQTGHEQVVLDGDRDPVEPGERPPGAEPLGAGPGVAACAGLVDEHHRVETRVEPGDPGDTQVEQVLRLERAGPQCRPEAGEAEAPPGLGETHGAVSGMTMTAARSVSTPEEALSPDTMRRPAMSAPATTILRRCDPWVKPRSFRNQAWQGPCQGPRHEPIAPRPFAPPRGRPLSRRGFASRRNTLLCAPGEGKLRRPGGSDPGRIDVPSHRSRKRAPTNGEAEKPPYRPSRSSRIARRARPSSASRCMWISLAPEAIASLRL